MFCPWPRCVAKSIMLLKNPVSAWAEQHKWAYGLWGIVQKEVSLGGLRVTLNVIHDSLFACPKTDLRHVLMPNWWFNFHHLHSIFLQLDSSLCVHGLRCHYCRQEKKRNTCPSSHVTSSSLQVTSGHRKAVADVAKVIRSLRYTRQGKPQYLESLLLCIFPALICTARVLGADSVTSWINTVMWL